ncbi:hypothetical protein [Burkholderia gladioli]|uniref:hypothetical protein n=1 Tax=Burkholderia gladioli TaxID=28095 RepID=UPI00163FFB5C|nr:hypothetical protein [Burkholderia gladioli]
MANNLFITYDLKQNAGEKRDYNPVFTAIHGLGEAVHLELSQFYVNSSFSSKQAAEKVFATMRAGDKLVVVDATNKTSNWYGLSNGVATFIQQHWGT